MPDNSLASKKDNFAKEKFSFVAAGFGQNMVITFVSTFMLTYLLDGVGFSLAGTAALTTLMAVAKVWDAINDFFMGFMVDKTRTRWGKLRPYILFTALPIAVLTIMMFALPDISEGRRLVYFIIVSFLWDAAYTMCDVPYWSLAGVITTDIPRRVGLISAARTVGTVALGAITLAGPLLAKLFSGGGETLPIGWTRAAILVSVFGMGLFTLAFFGTKEKITYSEKPETLRQIFTATMHNKPLLLVLLGTILNFGKLIIQVGGPMIASILFGDEGSFTLLGAAVIAGMLPATIITPRISKRIGNKRLMQICNLAGIVVHAVLYFIGFSNFWLVLLFMFFSGVFNGFFMVVQTAMVADCVDYAEYATGKRTEGICFAGLTFSSKLMGALSTLAFSALLIIFRYTKGVLITPEIQSGVFLSLTLIPAVSCLLSALPFISYPLTPGKMQEISALLADKRQTETKTKE